MPLPIGGFMPIPLAMMVPFMALQSIVMGDAFGKAYQFGKRKISAMSNEDFNNTSLSDLIANMQQEFKQSIPSIKQSIKDSSDLQNTIINEMLLILPKFVTQSGFTDAGAETGKIIAETLQPLTTQDTTKSNIEYKGILETLVTKLLGSLETGLTPPAEAELTPPPPDIIQGPTEGPPNLKETSPIINLWQIAQDKHKAQLAKAEAIKQQSIGLQAKITSAKGSSPTTGRKTIIFKYPLSKQAGFSSRDQRFVLITPPIYRQQVYVFDLNGHRRKRLQISKIVFSGRTTNLSKVNTKNMYIAYLQALSKAYPGKKF